MDCGDFVRFDGIIDLDAHFAVVPQWVTALTYALGLMDSVVPQSFRLTGPRTGDRWPVASNLTEYCLNQYNDDAVSAWRTRHEGADGKCLDVLQSMRRFGWLDAIVLTVACLLVCSAILLDRQQQLYTRYLRKQLLPPPWRSLRAAAFLLVEVLCSALLPSVTMAMMLLVFAGNTSSTDVLLNGVAIAFVLTIDDELPSIMLSAADKQAIDCFAESVGDRGYTNSDRTGALALPRT